MAVLIAGIASGVRAGEVPPHLTWTEDSRTTVTISWERPASARGTVEYGFTGDYTHVIRDDGARRAHQITIRGLQPGTEYHYRVSSDDGYSTADRTFRTAPAPTGTLHFVVHGDLHGGIDTNGARSVAAAIVANDPDLVIHMGDLSSEDGIPGFSSWEQFFHIATDELERVVFMPAPGNHDDPSKGSAYYYRMFPLPARPSDRSWYSFDAGNIHFVVPNSDLDVAAQTNWLQLDLQAAAQDPNVEWIIPYFHRPPYSWGERGGEEVVKTNWCPAFVRYEADIAFSGHSHNYQRTVPIRGVTYVVAGGGGGRLYYTTFTPGSHEHATTCYHFVSCHVTGSVMRYQAIRSDGLVFEDLVISNKGRVVRYSPAFPRRGRNVTITYDASQGPLSSSPAVWLHLGIDAFTNAVFNGAMSYNPASRRWEQDVLVPTNAGHRLAFVFHDGAGTWDNNYDHNWQALLGRVGFDPALPLAGAPVVIRYDADIGPLAGSGQIYARVAFNDGRQCAGDVVMTNRPATNAWECAVSVPSYASSIHVLFHNGSSWDDNHGVEWQAQVQNPDGSEPGRSLPMVAPGTPVITTNPPPQNNAGDNFDFSMAGPPLTATGTRRGFGDFGRMFFNHDSSKFYVGGIDADLGGTNNVMVLFLGFDTLTDDAWNLRHKSGLPGALDDLHNVAFSDPMDIAVVFGDEWGDGPAYTNFTYGGADFGQGLYYLSTNSASFVAVGGARLSQFDGTGTAACVTDDDDGNRQVDRWEASIPWSALNASGGATALHHVLVLGVIGSDSVTDGNRYLSASFVGEKAYASRDEYGQFAKTDVVIDPAQAVLGHTDHDGDGLPNGWEFAQFGSPEGPGPGDDGDGDGFSNWGEYVAGTEPTNDLSVLLVSPARAETGDWVITWPGAPDRTYDVDRQTNAATGFQPLVTNLAANAYTDTVSGISRALYRIRVRY